MKEALLMRYSLIPFWYTLHYEAATFSRTVVQPLFFEYEYITHRRRKKNFYSKFRYPDDANAYNIDQQFLIGRALLVSPNLKSVKQSI